jgi:hypothetical protein
VSLTASFRGSKVRKKIIREISKIYKNSQNAKKIKKLLKYLQEKCLVMRIGWKMHYLQPITWFYDFFLPTTKIFQKFIKPTKKLLWPKQKNKCLMVLNDKPNCQVSKILINPRPIMSDSSENHPVAECTATLDGEYNERLKISTDGSLKDESRFRDRHTRKHDKKPNLFRIILEFIFFLKISYVFTIVILVTIILHSNSFFPISTYIERSSYLYYTCSNYSSSFSPDWVSNKIAFFFLGRHYFYLPIVVLRSKNWNHKYIRDSITSFLALTFSLAVAGLTPLKTSRFVLTTVFVVSMNSPLFLVISANRFSVLVSRVRKEPRRIYEKRNYFNIISFCS